MGSARLVCLAVARTVRGMRCAAKDRLTLTIASLTMSAVTSQHCSAITIEPLRRRCDSVVVQEKDATYRCRRHVRRWRQQPSWAQQRRTSWEALLEI